MKIFQAGYYGTYWKGGIEYVYLYPRWQIPAYKLTVAIQWMLWKVGFAWHNVFSDECTPDFNCCLTKALR